MLSTVSSRDGELKDSNFGGLKCPYRSPSRIKSVSRAPNTLCVSQATSSEKKVPLFLGRPILISLDPFCIGDFFLRRIRRALKTYWLLENGSTRGLSRASRQVRSIVLEAAKIPESLSLAGRSIGDGRSDTDNKRRDNGSNFSSSAIKVVRLLLTNYLIPAKRRFASTCAFFSRSRMNERTRQVKKKKNIDAQVKTFTHKKSVRT